jgi:type 2 lantibiotic biosynthesis protein LanM
MEDAAGILAATGEPAGQNRRLGVRVEMPGWTEVLDGIMSHTREWFRTGSKGDRSGAKVWGESLRIAADPLPFEALLLPAVHFAARSLQERVDCKASLRIAPDAFGDLERYLLCQLAEVAEHALFAEFSKTRPYGRNFVLKIAGDRSGSPSRQLYDAFVRRLGEAGLEPLFAEYPVLARLMATRVALWIDTSTEFITRLERDWTKLHGFAAGPKDLVCKVTRIEVGLSDLHEGGRSVLAVSFSDHSKLIYKPRDVRLHHAFAAFLAWYNDGADLALRCPRALDGGRYGWVEYVEPRPLTTSENAARFYYRAGALMCLLYVLGGTDCHFENLIASDDEPILVDIETLFHADLADENDDSEVDVGEALKKVWASVLQTGMLPSLQFSADRSFALDMSGLGSDHIPAALRSEWRWSALNTDDMHRRRVECDPPKRDNIPMLHGERINSERHLDQIIDGFRSAYFALTARKQELLDPNGPLGAFRGLATRFVFRPTKVYAAILMRCFEPDALRNGIAWGFELELLTRAFVMTERQPRWWPLLEAELKDLVRLDIPYFTARTDSTSLHLSGGEQLTDTLATTSLSTVRRRVEALGPDDLAFQLEIVRGAYAARGSAEDVSAPAHECTATPGQWLTTETCVEEAQRIAESLAGRALRDAKGVLHWLGFAYIPEAQRLQLNLVPQGLYDGRCGIALFLAALDRFTREDRYFALWTDALAPFHKLLEKDSVEYRLFARSGLGMANGFGGVMYAFVRLHELAPASQQEWLLDMAKIVATFITKKRVSADSVLDLLGGSAGAIVALLALYRVTGDTSLIERASWCARHVANAYRERLLETQKARRPPLTGFSHGASGIAFALMKLYAVTGDRALDQTARLALEYEHSVYDPAEANWPDFRSGQKPPDFQVRWCHGAPGIALARLGILCAFPDADVASDWTTAIETTRASALLTVDHLCCGNLGLSDVLLTSALYRDRADLRACAVERAAQVVHRARETGRYRLFGGIKEEVFSPGLFQGVTGVGYQLLRLARPELLPSVLFFETNKAGTLTAGRWSG